MEETEKTVLQFVDLTGLTVFKDSMLEVVDKKITDVEFDDTELKGKISEVSTGLADLKTELKRGLDANEGVIKETLGIAQDLADHMQAAEAKYETKEVVAGVKSDVSTLEGKVATVEAELNGVEADEESGVVAKTGLKDRVAALEAEDNASADDLAAVEERVDALETAVGDATKGLVKDVAANTAAIAQNANDIADNTTAIAANTEAITKLNGAATVEGSVAKKVADEIAKVVAGAPEDLDTLKEIADYIASDKTGAAEINNKISALETKVGAPAAEGEDGETVAATGLYKAVADNAAAIADEKARVDALTSGENSVDTKIATALEDYSTTTEVEEKITAVTDAADAKFATKTALEAEETARKAAVEALYTKAQVDAAIATAKAEAIAAIPEMTAITEGEIRALFGTAEQA